MRRLGERCLGAAIPDLVGRVEKATLAKPEQVVARRSHPAVLSKCLSRLVDRPYIRERSLGMRRVHFNVRQRKTKESAPTFTSS
jgi:hypothetical protein